MVLEFGVQADTVRQLLQEVLDSASVVFGRYVQFGQKPIDRLFARISDTAAKRRWDYLWLTRRALGSFVRDELEAAVVAAGQQDETLKPIKAVPAFQDTSVVANRLFDQLVTLPWRYRLMLPLPFGTRGRSESSRFALADDFFAQTFSQLETEAITLHPANDVDAELRNRAYPGVIDTDTVYFVHEPLGYIPCNDSGSAVEEFVHAWKGFMGLLSLGKRLVPWLGEPRRQEPALPIVIHRLQDDGTAVLQPYKWLTAETTMTLGRFASDVRLDDELEEACEEIRPAFAHQPTRSACSWYVDSLSSTDGVLQVVQASMAIETLLGDEQESNEVGVTSLLANRLAFLIGGSPRHRQEVMDSFRRIYNVRSKIVHAGKASLDDEERGDLLELQALCRTALHTQLVGLRSDACAQRR